MINNKLIIVLSKYVVYTENFANIWHAYMRYIYILTILKSDAYNSDLGNKITN